MVRCHVDAPGNGSFKTRYLEMYENGKLKGWAVSVKTQANSDNGKGWYWYEVLSPTDASKIAGEGQGLGLCVGCHFPGKDFVVTGYPLK